MTDPESIWRSAAYRHPDALGDEHIPPLVPDRDVRGSGRGSAGRPAADRFPRVAIIPMPRRWTARTASRRGSPSFGLRAGRPDWAVPAQRAALCRGLFRHPQARRDGGQFLAALHGRGTGASGRRFGHARCCSRYRPRHCCRPRCKVLDTSSAIERLVVGSVAGALPGTKSLFYQPVPGQGSGGASG